MRITLDGHNFELKSDTGVLRTPLVEWPTNTRLDGQQRRKDRSLLSSYVIDDWSGGLGIERQNVENANHSTRLWDAENVDTRFPSQIVLSPAFNFATIVPSRGDLNFALQHLDQLYFLESQRVASIGYTKYDGSLPIGVGAVAYQFAAPNTLGSFQLLCRAHDTTDAPGATNVQVGSLSAIHSVGAQIGAVLCHYQADIAGIPPYNRLVSIPTMGGTISGVAINSVANLSDYGYNRLGQMTDMGGTLYILEHQNTNIVQLVIANQNFASPALNSIQSVVGSYLAPLANDGLKMYAYLPEGVYDFDITPSVVISTDRSRDKNAQQVMFRNELYFKNSRSLIHYDGANLTGVGYDLEGGLPSDKMGEITAMTSNFKWIYAAVKGATYSHILTRDQGGAWQYFARIPSAGLWVREMFLSNSPDTIDRLWCLFDNYGYPGYFLNPVVNPLVAGTYYFSDFIGQFTKPIFDGGLPEIPGAFYDTSWTIDKASSSIGGRILYGLNGASPTTTLLGIIATTAGNLVFGSPYGVDGRRIQTRIRLHKTPDPPLTNADTPIFRDAVIHYLKDPDKRETFDFTIDVKETARYAGLPQEAIIGTLSAIMDIKTLLPFHYGLVATRQVKVLDIPAQEDIESDNIMGGERSAFIRMRVAEIL